MSEEKNSFGLMTEADIFAKVVYAYALEDQHVGMKVEYEERGVRCRGLKFGNKLILFRDIGLAGIRPLSSLFKELGLEVRGFFTPHPALNLYILEAHQPALIKLWRDQALG